VPKSRLVEEDKLDDLIRAYEVMAKRQAYLAGVAWSDLRRVIRPWDGVGLLIVEWEFKE